MRDFNKADLVFLLLVFAIGVCFATYLAPMLTVLSLLISLPLIAIRIRHLGTWQVFRKIGFTGVLSISLCILILYFVQLRPYLRVAKHFPKQSLEETSVYSANILSILRNRSKFSVWYGPSEYSTYGEWEYAYFPGFILLSSGILCCILIVSAITKWLAKKSQAPFGKGLPVKNSVIPFDFLVYITGLFMFSLILSWGPFCKSDHSIKLPFYYLSQIIIGLDNVRAPGRFGMFVGLPLAVFLITSLRLLVARPAHRNIFGFLCLILIVIESLPKFPIFPFSVDSKGIYKQISEEIQSGTPLLELPVAGKDHFETIKIAMEQLDGSTIHWGKLVVGYGSNKTTAQYEEIVRIDRLIQQGFADPGRAIDFALQYDILHLLVHLDRYDSSVAWKWRQLVHEAEVVILFESEDALFLRLRNTH